MKISACIITFNEEKNIREAIESVSWADEILVVDSESSDRTRAIARDAGAKILVQKWLGFGRQKQFVVSNCIHDWIFSLDADERVSVELRDKILQLKSLPQNNLMQGYEIPRLTIYMNRPILHGGWYPDWQLRLFDRNFGKWKDVSVHESVQMNGDARIGKLKQNILHYSVSGAADHHRMIGERYAPLAAEQMFACGKRTSVLKTAVAGATTFLQTYVIKLGFLDGFAGFCIACFAAHHAFLKNLLLWEIQNKKT